MTMVLDVPVSNGLLGVADERLEAELCQGAADLAAGMARWLGLVAEYDRRRVWAQWECRSMANWLAGYIGISLVTARQYVQVANALVGLPLVAAEFASGRLSYSRVRALCRFVTPELEADMVVMARFATAAQLERMAGGVERARRQAEPSDAADQWDRRGLRLTLDDDGTWSVRGRLTGEMGTALRRALDAETARVNRQVDTAAKADAHAAGLVGAEVARACSRAVAALGSWEQRRADALIDLVGHGHLVRERDGDSAESPRPLIVLHRYPDGGEMERGPAVTSDVAERLACDGDHIDATHSDASAPSGGPSDSSESVAGGEEEQGIRYGRRRRVPTVSMRRMVEERDQACRAPGCGRRDHLHAHHVTYFARDGRTILRNLLMLCSHHHAAVHSRGWTITGTRDGALVFHPPGREPVPPADDGDLERLIGRVEDQAEVYGPIRVERYGDRFDLGYAVSNFLEAEASRRRKAATAGAA